jgi:hypothetical protein
MSFMRGVCLADSTEGGDLNEWIGDALRMGFISVIFGVLVFVLGVPLKVDWFRQNNYVLNAPFLVLVSFIVIGVVLNVVAVRKVNLRARSEAENADLDL